ncbi:hypothetical protein GCM10027415_21540 [Humibacter ginsengisoli]
MGVKWMAATATLGATLLAGAAFFALALLGNERRLRNEEATADDADEADE